MMEYWNGGKMGSYLKLAELTPSPGCMLCEPEAMQAGSGIRRK